MEISPMAHLREGVHTFVLKVVAESRQSKVKTIAVAVATLGAQHSDEVVLTQSL